jgi:methylenetetrahydrofolate--tRNA-(uracil-5-)-methyltransferase
MNVNFGLFPPIAKPAREHGDGRYSDKTIARKRALTTRALADLAEWIGGRALDAAE